MKKNVEEITLTRRAHLQALLAAAVAATVPGGIPARAADMPSAVPELAYLGAEQAKILLSVTRTLFPHDMLGDRFYWPIVSSIDVAMSDQANERAVTTGLAALGAGFSELDQAGREVALGKLEGSPFFSLAYTETINGLYTNKELWKLFGYEGSSVEHGGYINRGFDKIDWLPKDGESVQ